MNKTEVFSKKSLRFFALFVLGLIMAFPVMGQRADDANRKSKNGKTEGTIDGVNIVLEYGRPNVKSREVWGGLVAYDKVWRTGADEATTISFDNDVSINGQELAAGTYGLFTLPGKEGWQFIFNKVSDQWGAYSYKADQDVIRVKAKSASGEHVEAMDFIIEGNSVILRWGKLTVGFEVSGS